MARELKFRIWDRRLRKMLNCEDHPIVFHGENGWEVYGDVAWTDTDYEVMQFTGLKDKRGKDIYEGDFIAWGDDAWEVRSTDGGWDPFIGDCQTDGAWHYTVIGNIYENPEIIGAK